MKDRAAYFREYRSKTRGQKRAYDKTYNKSREKEPTEIIGIDGEGRTEFVLDEMGRTQPAIGQNGKRIHMLDDDKKPISTQIRSVHRYLYMAAWGHTRKVGDLDLEPTPAYVGNAPPWHDAASRTKACLDFFLSLPQEALLLGFSLGYDYTKILEGLDNSTLFRISRPEKRQGKFGPNPVRWGAWSDDAGEGTYKLNYVKGKLSIGKIQFGSHNTTSKTPCTRPDTRACTICNGTKVAPPKNGYLSGRECHECCQGCKAVRKCTVWDIFAFYQGSFIKACKEWDVVTQAEFDALKAMKEQRGAFTRAQWEEVKDYCGQECRKMAQLAEKLRTAHNDVGLKLKSYHGAGSTAAVMLTTKFRAKEFIAPPLPEMMHAIASAFFGGRFEVSRVGLIEVPVWDADIAGAYPYQFTFLPCLAHGSWELVPAGKNLLRRIEQADASGGIALVHYRLPYCDAIRVDRTTSSSDAPWGPFPLRAYGLNPRGDVTPSALQEYPGDGTIIYPVTSGGGWVYQREFLTSLEHFPNVEATEAWIFTPGCSHSPFNDSTGERETMAQQYITRLKWGKEGPGIVMKLGMNSCPGKTCQSVGNEPPFQCFIWGGLVNSGTRAQLLEGMACAKDPRSILMTATDSITSIEHLALPAPRDTGTAEAARQASEKAAFEAKLAGKPVPDPKHPLGAWETKKHKDGVMIIRPGIGFPIDSDVEATVKARGVGKTVLAMLRKRVIAEWREAPGTPIEVQREMFFGMKSATDPRRQGELYPSRRDNYGTWATQVQKVNYAPFPKRPGHGIDSKDGAAVRLRTWAFGQNVESDPYDKITKKQKYSPTAEARAESEEKTLQEEQSLFNDPDESFRTTERNDD